MRYKFSPYPDTQSRQDLSMQDYCLINKKANVLTLSIVKIKGESSLGNGLISSFDSQKKCFIISD
ncbi:hypothetical protein pgond44_11036 [Psychroflexus gondwanensis ACAM 44]|uniref:Uncharacterized protein n=1 Tax=Psychroflexus gondwanensis ACAM 44 TaxID=1189619 RepID=N1WTS1_9FLAO|nr:hypothetical protein pgond44_11036 [Psychroflexus gondwanensis ACAM 44]